MKEPEFNSQLNELLQRININNKTIASYSVLIPIDNMGAAVQSFFLTFS
jgi:hypothetical protein